LAYRDEPEGLLGVFEAPRFSPTDLLAGQNPLILVAVGTAKPGNLGAMVRTAAAAGATGVLAAGAMVDPFNPNAIRASTGAVFEVPVVHMPEADAIAWLQQHRIQILAALVDGTDAYCEVEAAGPTAVVIGPEDSGLGPAWDAAARAGGASVRIPMSTTAVDSLNASVTAGILLFDAVRRRRELGG
jgi:TrmH family RNA methyltransferase